MSQLAEQTNPESDAWGSISRESRRRWTLAGLLGGFGAAALLVGVGNDKHSAPQGLEQAVNSIAAGVQGASETVREQLSAVHESAQNLGIEQQIASRLHGDKSFDANQIQVRVELEGTAVLRGLVQDDQAKEKVVALTRDTRGVLKVVDHLAVIPQPRIFSGREQGLDVEPRAVPRQARFQKVNQELESPYRQVR